MTQNAVQLIGLSPADFIAEIAEKVKTSLLDELAKKMQTPEYLSADEVCRRLAVSKPSIHEWKNKGIIKSYKLGGRVYYRWDEVQNAMITN